MTSFLQMAGYAFMLGRQLFSLIFETMTIKEKNQRIETIPFHCEPPALPDYPASMAMGSFFYGRIVPFRNPDPNSVWLLLSSAGHVYGVQQISAFVSGLCRLSGIDEAA